jgi:hypothetical protein
VLINFLFPALQIQQTCVVHCLCSEGVSLDAIMMQQYRVRHYHFCIRAFCQGRRLLASPVTACFTAFKATVPAGYNEICPFTMWSLGNKVLETFDYKV